MLNGLISNKKGVSLLIHSKAVAKIASIMSSRLELKDKNINDAVYKASLLHDIGKAYSVFQNYIKDDIISEEYNVNKILHNEISWSFLRYLLNPDNKYDNSVLYSVYWHHSREMSGEDKEYASSILSKVSETDIQLLLDLYNHLTGDNKTKSDLDKDITTDKIQDYYPNNKKDLLPINTIVLTCVVSADRCVSPYNQERILSDDEYCNGIVDSIDFSPKKEFKIPETYDLNRFNYQLECVNNLKGHNTYELKAPAGFGKTMTGILAWVNSSNKKLIWVCPRNIIADSLYDSILKELDVLGLNNVSVELFLTGEKKKCNVEIDTEFSSDIIVTNIDNFLTPTIKNSIRDRMYLIMSSFVIFDEFHELVSSDPYFSCFVNIMRSRHRYTNSTTLLMSATPSLVTNMWDTINNRTKILPDNKTHYNAAHNKKYKINLVNNVSCVQPKNNHLFITNAISTSQKFTIDKNYSLISHSKYIDEDRKQIIGNIFNIFGKNKSIENKVDVISAPIIQAAMDISFCGVTEIPKSPEDTFQRLGRNGRWGEYDVVDFNIVTEISNKDIEAKEDAAIRKTYNTGLNQLWIKFLKENVKEQEYTLNELYVLYNEFNNKNKSVIENYIETQYNASLNKLSTLFPKKYNTKTKKSDKPNSLGVTIKGLRDNGFEKIYCIYPLFEDETKFCDSFQIEDNDDISNNEDNNTQNNQLKAIKTLLNDERFNYNSYSLFKNSKFTSQKLKQKAKDPKTPYICFHKVYHKKLGLIDKKLLK